MSEVPIEKLLTALAVGFMAFLGWFGRRHVVKVEKLAETSVSRDEFHQHIKSLRDEMQKNFNRLHDRLDK